MDHIEDMADRVRMLDEPLPTPLDVWAAFGLNNPVGTARTPLELIQVINLGLRDSPTSEVMILPEGAKPTEDAEGRADRIAELEDVLLALVENEEESAKESFGANWAFAMKQRDRRCYELCRRSRIVLGDKRMRLPAQGGSH